VYRAQCCRRGAGAVAQLREVFFVNQSAVLQARHERTADIEGIGKRSRGTDFIPKWESIVYRLRNLKKRISEFDC